MKMAFRSDNHQQSEWAQITRSANESKMTTLPDYTALWKPTYEAKMATDASVKTSKKIQMITNI